MSIVTPAASIPWTVTTFTVGVGATKPVSILYDGANVWVADGGLNVLVKLDAAGAVLQTVTVGANPFHPVFDGTNIWVPNHDSNSVTVVRGSSGAVLQTLTGNDLGGPSSAAFDGERVLVTNSSGNHVSLFKAANLSAIGSVPAGAGVNSNAVCSDGIGFWVTLTGASSAVARF